MADPKIPVLCVFECPRCGRKGVYDVKAVTLCQSCVNEFLAKHVGVMTPLLNTEQDDGIPNSEDV